jgi:pimeloyl-ACP methyl ester carboxylesterase
VCVCVCVCVYVCVCVCVFLYSSSCILRLYFVRDAQDHGDAHMLLSAFWNMHVTPQGIVRSLGKWLGMKVVQAFAARRFVGESVTAIRQISEYMYHLWIVRSDAEMAYRTLIGIRGYGKKVQPLALFFPLYLCEPLPDTPKTADIPSRPGPIQPLCARLHKLRAPATFIFGEHDWRPHTPADDILPKLPVVAKVVLIRDASHHSYMDNYQHFNALVCRALTDGMDGKAAGKREPSFYVPSPENSARVGSDLRS